MKTDEREYWYKGMMVTREEARRMAIGELTKHVNRMLGVVNGDTSVIEQAVVNGCKKYDGRSVYCDIHT